MSEKIVDIIKNVLDASHIDNAYAALLNKRATMPSDGNYSTANLVDTINTIALAKYIPGDKNNIDISTYIDIEKTEEIGYINALGYRYDSSLLSFQEIDSDTLYAKGKNSHVEGANDNLFDIKNDDEKNYIYKVNNIIYIKNSGTTTLITTYIQSGNILELKDNDNNTIYVYVENISKNENNLYILQFKNTTINSNIAYSYSIYQKYNGFNFGDNGHLEGYNNIIIGRSCHAEGENNIAFDNSHVEGGSNTAINTSHVEGGSNTATNKSHAEGDTTQAYLVSHAEGVDTFACNISHSEGRSTHAIGINSHTEGNNTLAYGNYSHAEGQSLIYDIFNNNETKNTLYYNDIIISKVNNDIIINLIVNNEADNIINTNINKLQDATDIIFGGSNSDNIPYWYTYVIPLNLDKNDKKIQYNINTKTLTIYINNFFIINKNIITDLKYFTFIKHCSIAKGIASHAEGFNTLALVNYSHAEGHNTYVDGIAAHAEGYNTKANGDYSHAEGYENKAIDMYANAIGSYTTANGKAAHTEGGSTVANGDYSHAEGYNTNTDGKYAHAEGYKTYVEGEAAHAEGYDTSAFGDYSHAEGHNTSTYGEASHVEGFNTYITDAASYAHAEGYNTYVSGAAAHAEGCDTSALDKYSHAEGHNTYAEGEAAHAEGYDTTVSGAAAHAEGYNTSALVKYSHAEGYQTKADGIAAHAEGSFTTASGAYSHAEGYETKASGKYSHAEGFGTIASSFTLHVSGQCNIEDDSNSKIFIIGNGLNGTHRQNALTVDYDYASSTPIHGKVNGIADVYIGTPIGTIVMYAGEDIPDGWALCDGTEIKGINKDYSIQDPTADISINNINNKSKKIKKGELLQLVKIIKLLYGGKDDYVNLPNFRGMFPIGTGVGTDENHISKSFDLGKREGEYIHLLKIEETPKHRHVYSTDDLPKDDSTYIGMEWKQEDGYTNYGSDGKQYGARLYTSYAGGNYGENGTLTDVPIREQNAHNNIPPYIAINFIIKYK